MEISESRVEELLFSDFLNLIPEVKEKTKLLEKHFIIIGEIEEIGSKIVKLVDPFKETESPIFLIAKNTHLIEEIRKEDTTTIRAIIKMELEGETLNLVLIDYKPIKEFAELKKYYQTIIKEEHKLNTFLKNDI